LAVGDAVVSVTSKIRRSRATRGTLEERRSLQTSLKLQKWFMYLRKYLLILR
jgi:hypothetical protein